MAQIALRVAPLLVLCVACASLPATARPGGWGHRAGGGLQLPAMLHPAPFLSAPRIAPYVPPPRIAPRFSLTPAPRDLLDEGQKTRFNALGSDDASDRQITRDVIQICSESASGMAGIPIERIERGVRPDAAQRASLRHLADALTSAGDPLEIELSRRERDHSSAANRRDGAAAQQHAARG